MWTDQKWVLITLKKPWSSLAPASYWISWFFSTHYLFFRFQLIFWAVALHSWKHFLLVANCGSFLLGAEKPLFTNELLELLLTSNYSWYFFFFACFLTWGDAYILPLILVFHRWSDVLRQSFLKLLLLLYKVVALKDVKIDFLNAVLILTFPFGPNLHSYGG